MPLITPAILTDNFDEFERQIRRLETLFSYAQIDVMDGKLVPTTSFAEVERVAEVKTGLRYEVHLMVEHPYEELLRWGEIRNVSRIIFHAEAKSDPHAIIEECRARGLEVGVALNPETPTSAIDAYVHDLDLVQFMTVHPGRQGAPFLPEMKEKILAFCQIPHRPRVSVDGGINQDTIHEVASWGVEIVNVGSYFAQAPDVAEALIELRKILS
jgi:ribulose-phosphate 3-epimerase